MTRQQLRIRSINIGSPRDLAVGDRIVKTAIFKQPQSGPCAFTRTTLVGDTQVDRRNHGGPDQAVYVYPLEHYQYWQAVLGRDDFQYGQFGENLTVEGMLEDEVCIGDTYAVGGATVQVSQPRVPCFKLGLRMQNPDFVRLFHDRCRIGFYFRVIDEGVATAGDPIELIQSWPERMSVRKTFRLRFQDRDDREAARRASQHEGLSLQWRKHFARQSLGAE